MREIVRKICERLPPERRRAIITAVGAAGLLLIFLSGILPPRSSEKTAEEPPPQAESDYRRELEEELTDIIGAIDGVGAVRVMITMDSTAEDVYAVDRSESESSRAGESDKDVQRNSENAYVIVKARDGSEQAVLKKQRMPEIRGVLIVCDGGSSAVVREKVTAAAAGALGIARGAVFVTS